MITVYWKNNLLHKIVQLSLSEYSDNEYIVVSCVGVTVKGTLVDVRVPFDLIEKGKIKETILKYAKDENVFAKGLGIFSNITVDGSLE